MIYLQLPETGSAGRGRSCRAGWGWDRSLDAGLPLSRYTLSPPDGDKWRKHEREIEAALAQLVAGTGAAAGVRGRVA